MIAQHVQNTFSHPYEKTEAQLKHTAKLWMKIGYRDHVVTNDEISCSGCNAVWNSRIRNNVSNIIDRRYPVNCKLFSWGTLVCPLMGILFHPMRFDLLGIIELITTFIALHGMLIIYRQTKNAWGCVFAFMFIWNAI